MLVTHNIEEAVLMCDRLIILSSNPARIAAEIAITMPHPRNRLEEEFGNIVDNVYAVLTARTIASLSALKQTHEGLAQPSASGVSQPHERVDRDSGSATLCGPSGARHPMAKSLSLEINELFPTAEGLHILEFAELKDGAFKLTAAGHVFAAQQYRRA